MRLSQYFLPTLKENPKEAEIASHRLMLRAGMIRQASAGIYSWLPLGLKVLRKIENIVREEQNKAGAQEFLMPTIQPADLWKESGRFDDYGPEMLRITDRHDREMLYGPTNEELITDIFRQNVRSYKDLPKNLYHIQWKFRDEIRPRFGVMRGREFLMKDNYSFDIDVEAGRRSYNAMFLAYLRTFARLGLKALPMKADSGPIGGESHEFIILAETGESEVYFDKGFEDLDPMTENDDYTDTANLEDVVKRWTSMYAATDEVHDASTAPKELITGRGIEVGHIFFFGTKYSEPMGATVQNSDGEIVTVQMGSYGIGVSRLVGGIIEASHDDNGIIWPESVAPYDFGIINMRVDNEECTSLCDRLYAEMQAAGKDVLYDDRNERGGAKFSNMDLIGVPWQVIIGPKGVEKGVVELKNRKTGEREDVPVDAFLARFK